MADACRQAWTAEQYFADPSLSNSKLSVFRDSPALYHGIYVVKTIAEPAPTAAMRLGTLVHLAVLEPDEYERRVVVDMVPPPYEGKGAKARREEFTAERAAWLAELPADVLLVDDADQARVEAMRDAVFAHPFAKGILPVVEREVVVTWRDDETGLDCRARIDILAPGGILDLKTAADPGEGFATSAGRFGYHRQGAFYTEAGRALLGKRPRFAFIVVRSAPPYEVAVWHMEPDDIAAATMQNKRSMLRLRTCIDTDTWVAPWECPNGQTLKLPRWALQEE